MNVGPKDRAGLEDLLRFYAEAGVDAALEEAPVDRFAEGVAARQAGESRPEARNVRETPRQAEVAQPGGFGAAPPPRERGPAPAQAPTAVPDEAQAARAPTAARARRNRSTNCVPCSTRSTAAT